MSDTQNMPVPDFEDMNEQEAQAALNQTEGGRNKPLNIPSDAEVYHSEKTKTTYSRFTEQVVIQTAQRSVTADGSKIAVGVQVKCRQSEVNSGMSVWFNFYIAPSAEGLLPTQVEYREKQRGRVISLLAACGLIDPKDGLKGSMFNFCFPQKGEPGKSSPLVGKVVYASICQVDKPAVDKNKKAVLNEAGVQMMEKKDEVENFLPETTEE